MKGFGGSFTADDKEFDPLLREIASRELFYLETATSTVAGTRAGDQRRRCAGRCVLAALPQPEAIEPGLKRLEAMACCKGVTREAARALPSPVSVVGRSPVPLAYAAPY
jgi:polysaccharide deacetylase 2 family uncharacterized protein YibQ